MKDSDFLIKKFTVGRCRVEILYDQDAESPRKWSNLGTMACWHRRYDLGDEQPKGDPNEYLLDLARQCVSPKYPEAILEANLDEILKANYTILPLGLHDHSGITMHVGARHRQDDAGWDSGQVGFTYVSLEKAASWTRNQDDFATSKNQPDWDAIVQTLDNKKTTLRECAESMMTLEVETYSTYLEGSVMEYVVYGPDDTVLDSLCGMYDDDDDYVEKEARASAQWEDERLAKIETETQMAEVCP